MARAKRAKGRRFRVFLNATAAFPCCFPRCFLPVANPVVYGLPPSYKLHMRTMQWPDLWRHVQACFAGVVMTVHFNAAERRGTLTPQQAIICRNSKTSAQHNATRADTIEPSSQLAQHTSSRFIIQIEPTPIRWMDETSTYKMYSVPSD